MWLYYCYLDPSEYAGESVHPLLRNIAAILISCTTIIIQYMYRKANYVTDRAAVYIAEHLEIFL